ncbi:hypothetical protein KFE25_014030 [Diacronema lutheri]|uniref:Protochlorophyllide reductase n=2 Tax=Diacronema lutheri TaxID=2081491 RepID=A0A8J5X6A8_DIALT|nr:hypothetical protein KFE25_014030 [Diacronema lutheri]
MAWRVLTYVVLVIAVAVGLLVTGVPTQLGFWRWLVNCTGHPFLVGFAPGFMRPGDNQYSYEELGKLDLSGQSAIVTGANIGLGYETALHLTRQGAHVILACRNAGKCADAAARIAANTTRGSVEAATLDTSSLQSVRSFAEGMLARQSTLDMLVLNAGIGFQQQKELSADGIDMTFATNHLGHFHLFQLLLPLLESGGKTGAARVVLVSSAAHFDSFDYGVATSVEQLTAIAPGQQMHYGMSKLAQVLFAQEATSRLPADSKVFINACHPGAVDTNLWERVLDQFGREKLLVRIFALIVDRMRKDFIWRTEDGALTQLFLAADSAAISTRNLRGRYFHPQALEVAPCKKHATNLTLQRELWAFSERLVADALAK